MSLNGIPTDCGPVFLSRPRVLRLLDTLENVGVSASTWYFPPGLRPAEAEKALAQLDDTRRDAVLRNVSASSTGAAVFWGDERRLVLRPPFPISDRLELPGYHVEPLRRLLQEERVIGVVLVRLGAFGIGVFQGDRLVTSKVGTGNIHQRHHQGGSSAHRFERHRDKQIETFFTRICVHAREHIEPHLRQLDHLVYGGTRETALELRKQCQFLDRLDRLRLERLLNIREPRQATLQAAIGDVYSSQVVEWD